MNQQHTQAVTGLTRFFVVVAELFLGVRFILRFFAASPTASFDHWVYTSSNTLLEPFRSIFSIQTIGHNHIVDFAALFAMLVYGLVGLAFAALGAWLNACVVTASKKRA